MASLPVNLISLREGCNRCSLQQLCLPAGIDAHELQELDEIVKRKRPVEAGERLFRQGDRLGSVYVPRDGAFKTVVVNEDGEEQIVGFHLPGELIGLDALGDGAHRSEAIALTRANVCEVPFTELEHVASHIPGLQRQLLRVIGRSVGRDQDHRELLMRRQANERIALFLHGLRERLQLIGEPGDVLSLPMTRDEIGRYLGLALETVSRGFTRLQEDGLIAVHGRRIEILDAAQLARLAHGNDGGATPAKARTRQ